MIQLNELKNYLGTALNIAMDIYPSGTRYKYEYSLDLAINKGWHLFSLHEVMIGKTIHDKNMKPLVHPLSMLTEEIKHPVTGEKFVPIERLQEIYSKRLRFDENGFYTHIDDSMVRRGGDIHFQGNQLEAYNYLFEWHFDVFDWIGKGLAIDKKETK